MSWSDTAREMQQEFLARPIGEARSWLRAQLDLVDSLDCEVPDQYTEAHRRAFFWLVDYLPDEVDDLLIVLRRLCVG